jgi:hypothetical protein
MGKALFIEGDALYETSEPEITFYLQAAIEAGLTAAWVTPVYKLLVTFAIELLGGRVLVHAKAFLLAAFWVNHAAEMQRTLDLLRSFISALQVLSRRCPKLGLAMLAAALDQNMNVIVRAAREQGLARIVLQNLDLYRYTEDWSRLAAFTIKWAFELAPFGGLRSIPVTFRKELTVGFRGITLDRIATIRKLTQGITNTLRHVSAVATPAIANKGVLAASLAKRFSEAGVGMSSEQARDIAECALRRQDLVSVLESLHTNARELEQVVASLSEAAQAEL